MKIKRWRNTSLSRGIQIIFSGVFLVVLTIIITLSNFQISRVMAELANDNMHESYITLKLKLQNQVIPVETLAMFIVAEAKDDIFDIRNNQVVKKVIHNYLNEFPYIRGTYWVEPNGNMIHFVRDKKGLKQETITRKNNKAYSTSVYYDEKGKVIKEESNKNTQYDPRIRPWYLAVKKKKKPLWSEIYQYYNKEDQNYGLTYSVPIYDDEGLIGIFNVDFRIKEIRDYLQTLHITPNAEILLLSDDEIVATYHEDNIELQLIDYTLKNINENKFKFKEHFSEFYFYDDKYYVFKNYLHVFNKKQIQLVIIIPEDDFVAQLKRSDNLTFIISLLLLLAGLFIITLFTKHITSQINSLIKQTQYIKDFRLDEPIKIKSHFKEVMQLSEAAEAMRNGLRSFKLFVPHDLVRALMKKGEVIKPGGIRKELTILFADIEGFTKMSETMETEALVDQLSQYFDVLSNKIIEHQGNIDKYIGDAIMAFWNAPIDDQEHTLHACEAALTMQEALKELNASWHKEGKQQFNARLGIHTGETLVGNFGSSQRLNYTTFSNAVNIASRIELINKLYGTSILVTSAVFEKVSDHFHFRFVDEVAVGAAEFHFSVYEMLGRKSQKIDYDVADFDEKFRAIHQVYQQDWQKALPLFEALLEEYPDDYLIKNYLKRIHKLSRKFQSNDWSGVWLISK